MLNFNYAQCPCCGQLHDCFEGGYIPDPESRKSWFVCLDCADEKTDAQILEEINRKRRIA